MKRVRLAAMVVLVGMMVSMLTPGASAATYSFKGISGSWYTVNSNSDVIMWGSTGEKVKVCQSMLKTFTSHNPGSIDGIFGNDTETAVKAYQKSKILSPDGIVGHNTWTNLYNTFTEYANAAIIYGWLVWGMAGM